MILLSTVKETYLKGMLRTIRYVRSDFHPLEVNQFLGQLSIFPPSQVPFIISAHTILSLFSGVHRFIFRLVWSLLIITLLLNEFIQFMEVAFQHRHITVYTQTRLQQFSHQATLEIKYGFEKAFDVWLCFKTPNQTTFDLTLR